MKFWDYVRENIVYIMQAVISIIIVEIAMAILDLSIWLKIGLPIFIVLVQMISFIVCYSKEMKKER